MTIFDYPLRTSSLVGSLIVITAACVSVSAFIRPSLRPNTLSKTISCKRTEASLTKSPPYRPEQFPGGRDVETSYGTIRVFEWGPEDGEKVMLLHGASTPCVALGNMAREFVNRGYRVMLFDLFGRGYSDGPCDLPHDDRLYTTQLLLVLASSPLPWTGSNAFHLIGFSLGGAIAASFAAYHAHLLRSLTLVCPGGLVRTSHRDWKSRLLYSEGMFPEWLLQGLARRRLRPSSRPFVHIPEGEDAGLDFDEVLVSTEDRSIRVGDVVEWQLDANPGFVAAYMGAIRRAPIYGHHDGVWTILRDQLARRRKGQSTKPQGLPQGRICLVLGDGDLIVVKDEWIEDSRRVLGPEAVDVRVLKGGHEIAITKGKEIAGIAIDSWGTE